MIGKRILVVDDEENLRRVTQLKLQQAGFEALTASDATNVQWGVHYWTALDRLGGALAKGGDSTY